MQSGLLSFERLDLTSLKEDQAFFGKLDYTLQSLMSIELRGIFGMRIFGRDLRHGHHALQV